MDSMESLDSVYARVAPRLLAFIRLKMGRSLRARLESRDILQATLVKSIQHLDEFKGDRDPNSAGRTRDPFTGWLMRIAENEIRDRADFHGRERRDVRREEDVQDHTGIAAEARSALSRVILDERAEDLAAALDTLTDAHREVILLRAFEELSFPEIGRRLGKSEDASRMLYARAMTALTLALPPES